MKRRTPHIIITIFIAIIALMGVWSAVSVSAQFPIREQFTTDLNGWTSLQDAVEWQAAGTVGTYYNPDGDVGSAVWTSAGSLKSPNIDIVDGSGTYTLHFDWYWTGEPITVTHGGVVGTGLNCYGSSWPPPFDYFVENQWNSCYVEFALYSGTAATTFEATSGALDMVQEFYLIPPAGDGVPGEDVNGTPVPVTATVTATPPPESCSSYTYDPTPNWVRTVIRYGNDLYFYQGDSGGLYVDDTAVSSSYGFEIIFQPSLTFTTDIVGYTFDMDYANGNDSFVRVQTSASTAFQPIQGSNAVIDADTSLFDLSGYDQIHSPNEVSGLSLRLNNYSWQPPDQVYNFSLTNISLLLSDGSVCSTTPTPPPPPPPPPSDYDLTCGLPTISGTETITETINANLLINGSFESGLTDWLTGTGDYSVVDATDWASDGSQVLYLPGTGAATVCQPWTVPADTVDHFSGGFDTRAGFLGTTMRAVDLVFSSNITAQIANGFVRPSDTLTWTVNSAGQNLPAGTTGQLCIVGDGGDVSAYVDRVYIHARDTLSDVVCIDPSIVITTTPTPTPAPSPTPTPPPPDNFPVPEIGDGGACYNCIMPTNILDFGQWIRWLLCGLNNLFYCYLYVWLMSIAGYISAGLQYIQVFYVWLPTVIQGLSDWLVLSLNGMSNFLIALLTSLSNWMVAGLEALSGQLVNMLNASSGLIVSVTQDVSDWLIVSLQNLSGWLVAALTGLSALLVNMLEAGSTWLTTSLQELSDWFTATLMNWYEWLLATVATVAAWGESGLYWLYSLLAGAVNTAVNSVLAMLSSVLSSLIASGAMLAEYAAAAWELIALYFSMLQQIAAAVVDLLDIIWRMTVGVLTAFTTDEATSVELFGYDIENMQQPNGINDASLFYWMVLGFMLADAAITSIPLMNVFIYTVMGLMSYGVILWTLRRGTKMLPIS